MAHYLVFIPDCTPQQLEAVAKTAGLSVIFADYQNRTPNAAGPDGQTGMMIGRAEGECLQTHYSPEQQTWIPSIVKDEHSKPLYFVGTWNGKPPTESELRRHYTQAGPRIKFGNQTWKLPTPDSVDARAVYADDGSMRWEVIRQFSWVCDEADALRETYLEEFGMREMVFQVDPTAQVGWLLKLLQINYRLLPEVAVNLDLWVGKEFVLDTFLTTLGLSRKADANGG